MLKKVEGSSHSKEVKRLKGTNTYVTYVLEYTAKDESNLGLD